MKFSASDIAGMLDGLGDDAVIESPGDPDKPVRIIFDPTSSSEMGVLTDKPHATLAVSDLSGVNLKIATLLYEGERYRMTRPLPDGTGFIAVLLTRN